MTWRKLDDVIATRAPGRATGSLGNHHARIAVQVVLPVLWPLATVTRPCVRIDRSISACLGQIVRPNTSCANTTGLAFAAAEGVGRLVRSSRRRRYSSRRARSSAAALELC